MAWGRELAGLAMALAATAVAMALVLPVWGAPLDVPFEYVGDANSHHLVAQSVLEGGWYYEQSRLGAPYGSELYDFPLADSASLALFWLLGRGTDEAAVVLNVSYLLGYLGIAATTLVALRALRVRMPLAVAGAVLYAFLPFHLMRGQAHLFLSGYVAVPLLGLVLLQRAGTEPAWPRTRHGRVAGAVTACLLVATTGIYYAAFAVLLLVAVGLLRVVVDRDPRRLAATAGLAALVVGVVLAQLAPALAYRAAEGRNPVAGVRTYGETELLGLKPVRLLLPIPAHRLEALRGPAAVEATGVTASEAGANLGAVGAVGLVGVLGAAAAAAGRPARPHPPHPPDPVAARLGVLALVATLLAAVGGFGGLLAVLGFADIRSWNRMSVVIGFCALAGAMVLADRALARRAVPGPAVALAAAALTVIGVWDQTPAPDRGARLATAAAWASDAAFVDAVEQQLPPGAAVLQLPYVPFPEGPIVGRMHDYDLLKGYLHSEDLRWSYGGMKGRQPPLYEQLAALPPDAMVAEARAAGFRGVYVDRLGYADGGAALEAGLRAAAGTEPLVSDDGRLAFYTL